MPIEVTIDPAAQLVVATCKGEVTLQDFISASDQVVVSDALPFAKLVDFADAWSAMTDDDMHVIGARFQAYLRHLSYTPPPLAIVATSTPGRNRAALLKALAEGDRPIRIFATIAEARSWLEAHKPK